MRVRSAAMLVFAASTIALTGCASGAASTTATSPTTASVTDIATTDPATANTNVGGTTAQQPAPPATGSTSSQNGSTNSPTGGSTGNGAADTCGAMSGSDAAAYAAAQIPVPEEVGSATWSSAAAEIGDYDPCAELSWIVLPIERGSGSSPYAIALFHNGEFIGPATAESYGFAPKITRVDDVTISVTYVWPDEDDANASPSLSTTVTFSYIDGAITMLGSLPPSGDEQACGMSAADAAALAASTLPAPFENSPWSADGADLSGYDPCATLSWIVLPIERGSGSSPYAIALFNEGQFIGPATLESYGFFPEITRVDDTTISVTYVWPDEDDANASPSLSTTVTFHFDGSYVQMEGTLPPS